MVIKYGGHAMGEEETALRFGAEDPKGGGVVHGARIFAQPTCHHRPDVLGGIGDGESAEGSVWEAADIAALNDRDSTSEVLEAATAAGVTRTAEPITTVPVLEFTITRAGASGVPEAPLDVRRQVAIPEAQILQRRTVRAGETGFAELSRHVESRLDLVPPGGRAGGRPVERGDAPDAVAARSGAVGVHIHFADFEFALIVLGQLVDDGLDHLRSLVGIRSMPPRSSACAAPVFAGWRWASSRAASARTPRRWAKSRASRSRKSPSAN